MQADKAQKASLDFVITEVLQFLDRGDVVAHVRCSVGFSAEFLV